VKAWWAERTGREQLTLGVAALALVLMLGWALLMHPLAQRQEVLAARIQAQRNSLSQLQEARALAESVTSAAGAQADRAGQSLASAVEEGLRMAGLAAAIRRIEPAGPDELGVYLEQAGFDPLVEWLQKAGPGLGMEVVEISIERAEQVGTVNVRMRLAENR